MSSQKRDSPDSNSSSSSDESSEMNNNQPQAKKLKVDEFSATVSGETNNKDLVVQDMDDQNEHFSSEEEDSDLEYEHDEFSGSGFDEFYTFKSRFEAKSPETKLEEIESMLSVWKNGKLKINETLDESEKLLEEIRGILKEARNVGKSTIETLQEKAQEQDEVFIEIQEVQDIIASNSNLPLENTLHLKGLQIKSYVLKAQSALLTKAAFAETKKGKYLTKKSEDHERRILDLITSQKERLVYFEKMICLTEAGKENVLKQMKDDIDEKKNAVQTALEAIEFVDSSEKEVKRMMYNGGQI